MPAHTVTLHLPTSLYDLFRSRAARANRTVETEILEAVQTAATTEASLAGELAEAVNDLKVLDDQALWRAARQELPRRDRRRLEVLSDTRARAGLDDVESKELEELLHEADRIMLVRAHAAKLLQDRGLDVSGLGP